MLESIDKRSLYNHYLSNVMSDKNMSMEDYCRKLLKDMGLLKEDKNACRSHSKVSSRRSKDQR